MISRTMVNCLTAWPGSRVTVSRTEVLAGPRIRSTASLRVSPSTLVSSILTMTSLASSPARAAGVSSIGLTTLTKPPSCITSSPRPPKFLAPHRGLEIVELLGVEIVGMRIERGEHSVDRRLGHLGLVGLVDEEIVLERGLIDVLIEREALFVPSSPWSPAKRRRANAERGADCKIVGRPGHRAQILSG